MRAAIFREANQPLDFAELTVDKPVDREILVRTVASGVCHSDLHFMDGQWSRLPLPAVMGHESAGIVQAVGEGVTYVKPGDHVVACLSIFCGQ